MAEISGIRIFYLIFFLRGIFTRLDEKIRAGIADGKVEISEYVVQIHEKFKLISDEIQQYKKSLEEERFQKIELIKKVHKYENMISKYKRKIETLKGENNA